MKELEQLVSDVQELFAVLDAHDVATFDCNRSGRTYCDCLELARKKVEQSLSKLKLPIDNLENQI